MIRTLLGETIEFQGKTWHDCKEVYVDGVFVVEDWDVTEYGHSLFLVPINEDGEDAWFEIDPGLILTQPIYLPNKPLPEMGFVYDLFNESVWDTVDWMHDIIDRRLSG